MRSAAWMTTGKLPWGRLRFQQGFTIMELLVSMAVLAVLAAIAVPNFQAYTERSRVSTAVADIRTLALKITTYQAETGSLPLSLDDVSSGSKRDPWGNLYQYLNIATTTNKGKVRKDHKLVPINSDYDLYSMGKDGQSQPPLTAKASRDDIVRANNGDYVGLAARY
jgi:general secretion pathway protein G